METVNLGAMAKTIKPDASPVTVSASVRPLNEDTQRHELVSTNSTMGEFDAKIKLASYDNAGKQLPQPDESTAEAREKIKEKVSELNSFVQNIQRGIQFSVHEETGRSVITITDIDTGEEIRRFPSEQMLLISSKISESLAVPSEKGLGLMVNSKA
ncbi:MAG: flagellar protein FlaG [Cycloclasticus sp.]